MKLNPQNNASSFDYKLFAERLLKKWYIFVSFLVIFLVAAFYYNQFSLPKYQVQTTMAIKKDHSNSPMDLFFGSAGGGGSMADEIVKLTSYPLILSTIRELDFAVDYYIPSPLENIELYKDSPIRLNIDANSTNIPYGEYWECEIINNKSYNLYVQDEKFTLNFGEDSKISNFIFSIELVNTENLDEYRNVLIKINRLNSLVSRYQGKLSILPVKEESSMLEISVIGSNEQKELDFVNKLVEKIIAHDINNKRAYSDKTVKFIDQQLAENTDSLQLIEGEIKQFKYNNSSVDPTLESNQLYSNIKQLEQEKANIQLSNQYYNYLIGSLSKQDVDELVVPSSMGVQDNILNDLIRRLVNLQLDVKLLMSDKKGKNPLVQEKQQTIADLKENILNNVENLKATNDIRLKDLDNRINLFSSSLRQMPEAERQLKVIERDYRASEEIYLLLMQKRLEAGIQFAAIESDYEIINHPMVIGLVSSSSLSIYILAILLALLLPAGIIYLIDVMSNIVHSKEEVKNITRLPIVGSIVRQSKTNKDSYRNPSFESFRSFRTNLKFLKQPTQVLLFSSSISGDGKSFCSVNMALTLSLADKKVVWIDADLRKEDKSYTYKNSSDRENGLTNYLTGAAPIETIIKPGSNQNLFFIKAGVFPPNPGELLINERMKQLLVELREQFDYIIVDTPPIGFFSDAFELISYVDHTFIIVRENHTKKSALQSSMEIIHNNKLNQRNISIVYNDFTSKHTAYGYGYGKGYYNKRKKKTKDSNHLATPAS
ncbi:MAG: polysaccharide biosynthesis tyrosine autokinase [Candidatus Cyclobacteriaceae bacterium M3_2C_046]